MMSSPATRARARLREDTITRLRAVLAEHPPADGTERVVLFGSLARGDFDGASDADLLVVGGDGTLDTGIWDAVGERDCDVIPWTREAWARPGRAPDMAGHCPEAHVAAANRADRGDDQAPAVGAASAKEALTREAAIRQRSISWAAARSLAWPRAVGPPRARCPGRRPSMILVLDGSVTLAWTTSDEVTPAVQDVFDRIIAAHAVVPALRPEVANGLHMGVRRGRLDAAERDATLADLATLDIRTDADTETHAWSGTVRLAERFGLTIYDACYLEPAQRRALPLASLDGDLRAAADACGVPLLGR